MANWISFSEKRKAMKEREEHLDKLFIKDYNDVYKIFQKIMKHGR